MSDPSKIATKLEQSSRKRGRHEKVTKPKEDPEALLKIQVNLALVCVINCMAPEFFKDLFLLKKHQGVSYFKRILL